MAKHGGLGRGLGGLIKDAAAAARPAEPKPQEAAVSGAGPARIPVASVRKSPWQPRRRFDETALAELTASDQLLAALGRVKVTLDSACAFVINR